MCKKVKTSVIKYIFVGFLLIKILDQIFKIPTIVETLVTLQEDLRKGLVRLLLQVKEQSMDLLSVNILLLITLVDSIFYIF